MDRVSRVYERLRTFYGPQRWWPAETPFEVVVGALLMQQTSWANVERAIENLKRARLLSATALADASIRSIRQQVRIAGLYRTKPGRLKDFCRYLVERWGGDLARFLARPTELVRADLLSLSGIGPETADSILLYAGNHPIFVVDAYTVRIASRIGLLDSDRYDEVQRYFDRRVPRILDTRRQYHALLVEHAKTLCRPRPRCNECPLRHDCDVGRGEKR